MTKKTHSKKMRLAKAANTNKRLPIFVAIRTKRKVTSNRNRRAWRTDKLRIEEE